MKITLKSLRLLNFKGVRDLSLEFGERESVISGDNGSGKTTVFDAVSWLLFDKDSTGSSSFSIKTLDAQGRVIHQLDHEVHGVFLRGSEQVALRKVYREKWQKRRGALHPELTGNETLYYCNDVPLKQGEYKLKVDAMLKEELFRLITSPYYFNTMRWQDRRSVLTQMAGSISDADIAAQRHEFVELLALIGSKTLEEYRREVAARKRKLNDDLRMIPARLDELHRGIPQGIDFEGLQRQASEYERQVASLDEQVADRGKLLEAFYQDKQHRQEQLSQLRSQRLQMEQEAIAEAERQNRERTRGREELASDVQALEGVVANAAQERARLQREHGQKAERCAQLEERIATLRKEWQEENAKALTWGDGDFVCPCCQRPLEPTDIEAKKAELLRSFHQSKDSKLDEINERGMSLSAELSEHRVRMEQLEGELAQVDAEQERRNGQLRGLRERLEQEGRNVRLVSADELLTSNLAYIRLKNQLQDLEEELSQLQPTTDTAELKARRVTLQEQLDACRRQLAVKGQIERAEQRIAELRAEESRLAQQLADLERSEFVMQEFTKARIDAIEARINGLFSLVRFRMFERQLNGAEAETCECTVNGVPYADLNTASKINAGLDIINALCRHYQVSAPIFIDGRESVNRIIPVESQLISLVVSNEPLTITQLS